MSHVAAKVGRSPCQVCGPRVFMCAQNISAERAHEIGDAAAHKYYQIANAAAHKCETQSDVVHVSA